MHSNGSISVQERNVNHDISSDCSVNTSVWSTLDANAQLQIRHSPHTYNLSTNHYRPNEQHQTLTLRQLTTISMTTGIAEKERSVTSTSLFPLSAAGFIPRNFVSSNISEFAVSAVRDDDASAHFNIRGFLSTLAFSVTAQCSITIDFFPLFLCCPAGYFRSSQGALCKG